MVNGSISIVPATEAALPDIVALLLAQHARQRARDPSLRHVGSPREVEAVLRHTHNDALVALTAEGRVRGYAQPAVWDLKETSILLAFLTARNGIVQNLVLPDPTDEDAEEVVAALLRALDSFWQKADTSGDLIRWPSNDSWLAGALAHQHFQLDSVCALRSREPFFVSRLTSLPHRHIRAAKSEDEDALVGLFEEELRFHERSIPFVRSSAQVVDAFRRKLGRIWKGESLEEGAPLVLVAEQAGAVVAMAENTLLTVTPGDEPGFTPPGRYWCLDNVSVHAGLQGQGIGRVLLQAIEDVIVVLDLDVAGYMLWFNPGNPSAARFWPRIGFQPLWTTYQRLHIKRSLE